MPDLGITTHRIDMSNITGVLLEDSGNVIPVVPGTFRISQPAFVLNSGSGSLWTLGGDAELWYFFTSDTSRQAQWGGPLRQIRGLIHGTDD